MTAAALGVESGCSVRDVRHRTRQARVEVAGGDTDPAV